MDGYIAASGVQAAVAGAVFCPSVAAQGIGWTSGLTGGTGVVLGKYNQVPNYLDAAKQIGANAFNLWKPIYSTLDFLGESWTANQAFINASIFRGQQFYLSTTPGSATGSYWLELQYLTSRGIGPDKWLMVNPTCQYIEEVASGSGTQQLDCCYRKTSADSSKICDRKTLFTFVCMVVGQTPRH